MAAQVFQLRSPLRWSRDWSQRELSEFYRVESALIQAGVRLHTDRGVTDEGEPWFVFCRQDDGEVFIHFARIDGEYVIDTGPMQGVARGLDFSGLVRDIIEHQPLAQARARRSQNVFLHPAALLIALVGGAFFHAADAKAATASHGSGHGADETWKRKLLLITSSLVDSLAQETLFDQTQASAVLTGVMIGLDSQAAWSAPAGRAAADASPPTIQWDAPTWSPADHWTAPPAPVFASQGQAEAALPTVTLASPPAFDQGRTLHAVWSPPTGGEGLSLPAPTHISDTLSLPTPLPNALAPLSLAGDAAQVVQSAYQANGAANAQIQTVSALPEFVTELVKHAAPAVHPTTDYVPPTAAVQPGAPAPAVDNAPAGPAPSPTPQLYDPNDLSVLTTVTAFMISAHTVDEYVANNSIIIMDAAILKPLPAGTQLEAVSFTFTDGAQLSLVGTAAEIQALHWNG